jgi:4-aminobutyrate aminotransferase-like enzyme
MQGEVVTITPPLTIGEDLLEGFVGAFAETLEDTSPG